MSVVNEIFSLLQIAEAKRVIEITPSLVPLTYEEAAENNKIFTTSISGKKFRFTFDDSFQAVSATLADKPEIINRGSKIVDALLNLTFSEYNVLVVKKAKIEMKDTSHLLHFMAPALGDGLSIDYAKSHLAQAPDNLDDYKLQIAFSVELKDSLEGGITIKRFISKAFVSFENGQLAFDFKTVFEPEEAKSPKDDFSDIRFDPDKKRELANNLDRIRVMLSSEKEKRGLFESICSTDEDVQAYLKSRVKLVGSLEEEPVMEFNVIPISISLNRVPYFYASYVLVSEYGKFTHKSARFNPFEPQGGKDDQEKTINQSNPIVLAFDQDGNASVALLSETAQVEAIYPHERYLLSCVEKDEITGLSYLKKDIVKCEAPAKRVYQGTTIEALDEKGKKHVVLDDDQYRSPKGFNPVYGDKVFWLKALEKDEEDGLLYVKTDLRACYPNGENIYFEKLIEAIDRAGGKQLTLEKYCAEADFNPLYSGSRYLSDAVEEDEVDHQRYFVGDMEQCPLSGLHVYKGNLQPYSCIFQDGAFYDVPGKAVSAKIVSCPNCNTAIAFARNDTRDGILMKNAKGEEVCCGKCADAHGKGKTYYLVSEITNFVYPDSEETFVCAHCGIAGEEREFIFSAAASGPLCPRCADHPFRNQSGRVSLRDDSTIGRFLHHVGPWIGKFPIFGVDAVHECNFGIEDHYICTSASGGIYIRYSKASDKILDYIPRVPLSLKGFQPVYGNNWFDRNEGGKKQ